MPKRIIYTNKAGEPMDIVARIVRRKSKEIIIKPIDCDNEIPIPNGAVESITEPEKELETKE